MFKQSSKSLVEQEKLTTADVKMISSIQDGGGCGEVVTSTRKERQCSEIFNA
jgi:hypothetical protein